jgi:hypothetical protein
LINDVALLITTLSLLILLTVFPLTLTLSRGEREPIDDEKYSLLPSGEELGMRGIN